MITLNHSKVLLRLYWFLFLPLFVSSSIHTFFELRPSSVYFRLINTWIFLVRKQLKILNLIKVVLFCIFSKLTTSYKSIFIGLDKRRDDIAHIHRVIFRAILVLFLIFAARQIIVFSVRFINQRTLLSFLFLPLLLQELRIPLSFDLK